MSALVPLDPKRSLELVERELGGRSAVIQALVTAPQTKDVRYVLGLLADPDNMRTSLADLCVQAKILPATLLEMVERGGKFRARVIASQIVADQTPAMVRDVMKKASPYEDDCSTCRGIGTVTPDPTENEPNPTPVSCPTCLGIGQLRYEPDDDCRKLGLEMAGLTAKGGGVIINNTQVNAPQVIGAGGAFEQLAELMDQMIYGRKPVVDGEVVK